MSIFTIIKGSVAKEHWESFKSSYEVVGSNDLPAAVLHSHLAQEKD